MRGIKSASRRSRHQVCHENEYQRCDRIGNDAWSRIQSETIINCFITSNSVPIQMQYQLPIQIAEILKILCECKLCINRRVGNAESPTSTHGQPCKPASSVRRKTVPAILPILSWRRIDMMILVKAHARVYHSCPAGWDSEGQRPNQGACALRSI
jgi:hypothetical protein